MSTYQVVSILIILNTKIVSIWQHEPATPAHSGSVTPVSMCREYVSVEVEISNLSAWKSHERKEISHHNNLKSSVLLHPVVVFCKH